HLHEHVAGEELALRLHLAPALDLDDLLGRHQHLFEKALEPGRLCALTDGVGHLALEVRVRMHDVPALRHGRFLRARLLREICGHFFFRLRTAPQCGPPNTNRTSQPRIWSVTRKNIEARVTMTKTMRVVIHTS